MRFIIGIPEKVYNTDKEGLFIRVFEQGLTKNQVVEIWEKVKKAREVKDNSKYHSLKELDNMSPMLYNMMYEKAVVIPMYKLDHFEDK
jgi:hypothetical protein